MRNRKILSAILATMMLISLMSPLASAFSSNSEPINITDYKTNSNYYAGAHSGSSTVSEFDEYGAEEIVTYTFMTPYSFMASRFEVQTN